MGAASYCQQCVLTYQRELPTITFCSGDRSRWMGLENTFMNTKMTMAVVGVGLILATSTGIAHHSFAAEFDANKPVDLQGTVTKVEWSNPHTYFYIDVTMPDGKVINWGMEMGSPNGLMKAGWTRNTLHVGDVVRVEGSRAKDGANVGNARAVTTSAGKRLFAASSQGETSTQK